MTDYVIDFHEDLYAKVVSGEKTVTRRPVKSDKCPYEVGQLVKGRFSPSPKTPRVELQIVSIRRVYLSPMTLKDIRNEGFQYWREFADFWQKIYRDTLYDTCNNPKVWRIEFKRVTR